MIWLRKRKRPKMGVREPINLEWPRHRRFVRSHECVVPGCKRTPIEFCHARLGAHAGKDQKPGDWFGYPGCIVHHNEQHKKGEATFQKTHQIDLHKIAGEMVRHSPDHRMREYMREHDIAIPEGR